MITLNQLRAEVGVLGFESLCAVDDSFVYALRRALGVAYTERAVIKETTLFCYYQDPVLYYKTLMHSPGEVISFSTDEGYYAFYAVGCGEYELTSNLSVERKSFNEPNGRLIHGKTKNGEIRFVGRYGFSVHDLTLHSGEVSMTGEDLIYSEQRSINLTDRIRDFGSIVSVSDKDGAEIGNASVKGDVLRIPSSFKGQVRVTYRAAPPEVDPESPDSPIAISRELLHLIPLLTAAYFWLDDDEEKSGYYLSLYREGMNDLKRTSARVYGNEYTDPRGWT